MNVSRVVEYVFFFGLLVIVGYLVWLIMSPFITALALSAIIVTICHPLYLHIQKRTPKQNKTAAAFFTTLIVVVLIVLPLSLITALVSREAVSVYHEFSNNQNLELQGMTLALETKANALFPGLNISINEQLSAIGEWIISNLGTIFASTVSVLFTFVLSMLGSFYFFRDGKELMQLLIKVSPLPDGEDEVIFERMARAVRAVAIGTLLIALIQGTLVALGFAIFGVPRAILWGTFASLGALMPGIGTTIVTAPAIIYLFFTGSTTMAIGLLIWSVIIVGLVDNLIGPYLIGRKNNMHPFIILISVLGGIGLFGPIGFIIGPVTVTLFFVLLEIYNQYIIKDKKVPEEELL
ncbi:MAG: AI-2E family transporter [Candidatus Pacebacteria bacterium]|nr:AI-2E family transporter [Candidatus Paceibacterota bacterium]